MDEIRKNWLKRHLKDAQNSLAIIYGEFEDGTNIAIAGLMSTADGCICETMELINALPVEVANGSHG